jgi:apolipoprotein D and lipocalin family protein
MTRKVRSRGPLLAGLAALGLACHHPALALHPVEEVDLDRYAGRWYEISSIPQRFQEGCVATTATYAPLEDGGLQVINECRDGSFDGELRSAEAIAWRADPEGRSGRLKVQFFWPFRADYWILALDPDYRFAVVGHPSRDYLWILSRTPALDPARYAMLLSHVEAQGFDASRLVLTPQPGAASAE